MCKYMHKHVKICSLCHNICTLYALWSSKICNVYMLKYAIYMQYICKYIHIQKKCHILDLK